MSDHTQAILDRQGQRATITIRTESGINVASVEFMQELGQALDELAVDRQVRFVVVRAAGKVFLAGANIKAMVGYNAQQAREMAELGHRVLNKLESLPQITVARIHGTALGGGCELSMACDFRFAVNAAVLGQPEVLLGLIPGWGGTIRLPRLVPLGVAKHLMFSGENITAEKAMKVGLVDEVVENEEALDALITSFYQRICKSGPAAVAAVKEALLTGREVDAFAGCFDRPEAREGMTAFLSKQPAPWTHINQ